MRIANTDAEMPSRLGIWTMSSCDLQCMAAPQPAMVVQTFTVGTQVGSDILAPFFRQGVGNATQGVCISTIERINPQPKQEVSPIYSFCDLPQAKSAMHILGEPAEPYSAEDWPTAALPSSASS